MAKSEVRTVWIAKNGQEFDTEEEAIQHEELIDLVSVLEDDSSGIYWRETCATEVVSFLLKHYNITKKVKS